MTDHPTIEVEVAYARPDKQKIITLSVAPGTTASEAVSLSGITKEFPEIDLGTAKLGLFGKHFGTKGIKAADEYVLQHWDRVEIYRPLIADPKEVRRRRAEKAKAEKQAAAKKP